MTLRSSLETYDQYDAIKLARRLEKHELLEFRRIAALLYRVSSISIADRQFYAFRFIPHSRSWTPVQSLSRPRRQKSKELNREWECTKNKANIQLNNMYEESLALSKADRLWRDALETAASSKDIAVAEELAGYFVSIGNKDAFAAILYVCFELVRPDFVEEMVSPHPLR